jgi:alpha-1,3/alpha-1,6-mannosyltransferase
MLNSSSAPEVVFLRPGLGIGGGERWCLDAARALAERGWRVRRVVGANESRMFADVNDGLAPPEGPLVLPPIRSDRLRTLKSILRLRRLARVWHRTGARPQVIVLDQLPHVTPLLRRLWPEARVLMYGHYPDGLLALRGSHFAARRVYRRWVDSWELRGLRACHAVAVNSDFTARKFNNYTRGSVSVDVIHPGVHYPAAAPAWLEGAELRALVVGRFDPDKQQTFALDAWAAARAQVGAAASAGWRLVLAGGCDERREASRKVFAQLTARIEAEGWQQSVTLRPEPSSAELEAEFAAANLLLHPMSGEHFGIVPVEGMAHGRPVLAVAGAGPDETVVEGVTGALRPQDAAAFGEVLASWSREPERMRAMGAAARAQAEKFSTAHFGTCWCRWVAQHGLRE